MGRLNHGFAGAPASSRRDNDFWCRCCSRHSHNDTNSHKTRDDDKADFFYRACNGRTHLSPILRSAHVVCIPRQHNWQRTLHNIWIARIIGILRRILTLQLQDEAHNKTTYTIFCPTTSADACNLALNFPFVVVEGPKTVEFHGTYTSTLYVFINCNFVTSHFNNVSRIIDIECKMDHDPAAATCSGYSSLKSGYSMGNATGPTSGSWTSTFTGTAAEWANLTLATSPTPTGDSTESSNDATSGLSATALLYIPEETGESSASSYGNGLKLTAMAVAVSIGSLLL